MNRRASGWSAFWEGFRSLFTFGSAPTRQAFTISIARSPEDALRRDWKAIGNDLKTAIDEVAREVRDASSLQDAIDEGGPLLSPEETRRELGLEP